MPYFGTREFPAHFKACEDVSPSRGFYAVDGERDLGLMLYDMDYRDPKNITPMFFRMTSCRDRRDRREKEAKVFR